MATTVAITEVPEPAAAGDHDPVAVAWRPCAPLHSLDPYDWHLYTDWLLDRQEADTPAEAAYLAGVRRVAVALAGDRRLFMGWQFIGRDHGQHPTLVRSAPADCFLKYPRLRLHWIRRDWLRPHLRAADARPPRAPGEFPAWCGTPETYNCPGMTELWTVAPPEFLATLRGRYFSVLAAPELPEAWALPEVGAAAAPAAPAGSAATPPGPHA